MNGFSAARQIAAFLGLAAFLSLSRPARGGGFDVVERRDPNFGGPTAQQENIYRREMQIEEAHLLDHQKLMDEKAVEVFTQWKQPDKPPPLVAPSKSPVLLTVGPSTPSTSLAAKPHVLPPVLLDYFSKKFTPIHVDPAKSTNVAMTPASGQAQGAVEDFIRFSATGLDPSVALHLHGVSATQPTGNSVLLRYLDVGKVDGAQFTPPDVALIRRYIQSRDVPPTSLFVEGALMYQNARAAVDSLSMAAPPLVIFRRTFQSPARIEQQLDKTVANMWILHSIPSTREEGEIVHPGQRGSFANSTFQWGQRRASMQAIQGTNDIGDYKSPGQTHADALGQLLDQAVGKVDFVAVVGEVRDGIMYFPDGSSKPVSGMSRSGVTVAIVGCNSAEGVVPSWNTLSIGMGSWVNYHGAIDLSRTLSEASKAKKTQRQMMLDLQRQRGTGEHPAPATAAKFFVYVSLLSHDSCDTMKPTGMEV